MHARLRTLVASLRSRLSTQIATMQYKRISKSGGQIKDEWSFSEVNENLLDERDRYANFLGAYLRLAPDEVRRHRQYFSSDARGFGEDAFHGMWWKLLDEFRPSCAIEIGVYRGQTISLWAIIARDLQFDLEVWGLSPLTDAGDAVSNYPKIDYKSDIETNYQAFDLGAPKLIQAVSGEKVAKEFLATRKWGLVYLDGSHDFEDVVNDLELIRDCTQPGAILVMDDASLYSAYIPYRFSFAGHPGPSRAATSPKVMKNFIEIGTCGHNRVFQRV